MEPSRLRIKYLQQNYKGYPKIMNQASCKAPHAPNRQDIHLFAILLDQQTPKLMLFETLL